MAQVSRHQSIAPDATHSGKKPALALRFACPYFNMFGHQGVKGRACTGEGFPDVHRIKGHLYRLHEPPIACPRCYAEFDDPNDVTVHLRRESICELTSVPLINTKTTFTEAQKQELKRRSVKNTGLLNEIEQCEDLYRILFPNTTLPKTLYVNGGEVRPELELQTTVKTALLELLLNKIPNEAKYVELGIKLNEFIDTANASGFMDEAAEIINQKQKRRRISKENSDEQGMDTCDHKKTLSDINNGPPNPTMEERSQPLRPSDHLPSHPLSDFLNSSWALEDIVVAGSTASSLCGPDALHQVNYESYVETMDQFLQDLQHNHPEFKAPLGDGEPGKKDADGQDNS